MAVLVGSIVLMDLRLLGLCLRTMKVDELWRRLKLWTHAGLAVILTTGPLMFVSDRPRYVANPAFRFKMLFVALALVTHFTSHRKAVRTGQGRLAAMVSILIWSCVVIGGRAIADFDV